MSAPHFDFAFVGDLPTFSIEPDVKVMERIVRQHLSIARCAACDVSFLDEGVFNRVYKVNTLIDSQARAFAFRVGLPLEMPYKVGSEVSTISFLRLHTNAPIPEVYAFNPTNENELHYPWILMDFVDGRPLNFSRWKRLSFDKKIRLAKQLAELQSQLYRITFDQIGSLHGASTAPVRLESFSSSSVSYTSASNSARKWTVGYVILYCISFFLMALFTCIKHVWCHLRWSAVDGTSKNNIYLGRIVSMDFILVQPTTSRGPFFSTEDWLNTRLRDAQGRQGQKVNTYASQGNNQEEYWQDMVSFTTRLLYLVPNMFPRPVEPESMRLLIHDLHAGNVLVNDSGDLAGIVDWEFTSTTPLWNACQPPKFLEPVDVRNERPLREDYPPIEHDPFAEPEDGVSSEYFEHLQDYETTQLREIFIHEMDRSTPGWSERYREGKSKREFLLLVNSSDRCEHESYFAEYRWLDKFEAGELTDKILDGEDDESVYALSWRDDDANDGLDDEEKDEEDGGVEENEYQAIRGLEDVDDEENLRRRLDSKRTLDEDISPDTTLTNQVDLRDVKLFSVPNDQ